MIYATREDALAQYHDKPLHVEGCSFGFEGCAHMCGCNESTAVASRNQDGGVVQVGTMHCGGTQPPSMVGSLGRSVAVR